MASLLGSLLFLGATANYTNPIVNQDCADPGVLQWKGDFYMVTTSGNAPNAYPIRKSKDLVHWDVIGYVFPQGQWPSWTKSDFWAPELHVTKDGSINVYYAASRTDGVLCVGVAKSTSGRPEGPYKDRGSALLTTSLGAIDPSFFLDDDGRQYVMYKVNGGESSHTPLDIQELDGSGMNLAGGSSPRTMIKLELPWEGDLIEAPWMVKQNGYYYVFYSANFFTSPRYSVGMARSRNVLGPYEKAAAPTISQFVPNSVNAWEGPGHCAVVQNVGVSNATYMIYHSWARGHSGQAPGRLVLADRVTWTSDGWAMTGDSYSPSTLSVGDPLQDGKPSWRLEVGKTYSLRSFNFPNAYWCYDGTINCQNTFTVRTGLAGGNTISLEATTRPGYYMRHANSKLRLDPLSSDPLFHNDASFMVVPGAEQTTGASFRPVNYPNNLIRHKDGVLQFSPPEDSSLFRSDATFIPIRA